MPPGVENLCLCIDFNASNGGGQPTTVSQARTVLHSKLFGHLIRRYGLTFPVGFSSADVLL